MNNITFAHVDTWIFDLDNTVYPPEFRLFHQIEERMRQFMASSLEISLDHADKLRSEYWEKHGTTLAGLMENHSVHPDAFLEFVHDIDFSVLPRDETLAKRIADLPGRKIIYTNGTRPYANCVLEARGLDGVFDAVFGIEHADYQPKPREAAYKRVFRLAEIEPKTSAFFEDEERNLEVPNQLGVRTVFVSPNKPTRGYVDFHCTRLVDGLRQIAADLCPSQQPQLT